MKTNKKIRVLFIVLGGFFLLLDQVLKWQVLHNWQQPHLLHHYFGWQLYINKGVAFGLPLPRSLTILLTSLIIILVIYFLSKERQHTYRLLAWVLILFGALSNLLDRIWRGYVVDYFAFITGVINLADIMIVVGLGLYLLLTLKNKKTNLNF